MRMVIFLAVLMTFLKVDFADAATVKFRYFGNDFYPNTSVTHSLSGVIEIDDSFFGGSLLGKAVEAEWFEHNRPVWLEKFTIPLYTYILMNITIGSNGQISSYSLSEFNGPPDHFITSSGDYFQDSNLSYNEFAPAGRWVVTGIPIPPAILFFLSSVFALIGLLRLR